MSMIISQLLDKHFLKMFDLLYAPGKHYFFATRRDSDHLVAGMSNQEFNEMVPDAVSCCVVFRDEGKEDTMLLNKEYRYPLGRFVYSVPAGLIDVSDQTVSERNEAILNAAKREVFEETGIRINSNDSVSIINPCIFASPGLTDESNAMVLFVLKNHQVSEINQDHAEGSEIIDGFEVVDKRHAMEIMKNDAISTYTWIGLSIFVNDMQ